MDDKHVSLEGLSEYRTVKLASGASITLDDLLKEGTLVSVEDYGAIALERRASGDECTYAISNTDAVNRAIAELSAVCGGTLVFPAGTFRIYTVVLQDNVNIRLDEGSRIQAARTRTYGRGGEVTGEAEDFYPDGAPGNYLQSEVNIYAGLQDGGHTYFANSLFYGAERKNIMIYGSGLIDGSQLNADGFVEQVLSGEDPANPTRRTGQCERWFGNKGIALLRCRNVILKDFRMLNCGHFAIINEGTVNMLIDGLLVDTNRDALDIDCGQDVTVINSHFNSLTDDAIVFKASFGAGLFMPVENCLVRNCIVSGYDAGSVLSGTYTTDKQVATDLCGPTARVKLGTESTCGYRRVTIDGTTFLRSRGFAIEAVDGSDVHDIVFVNSRMENVSSSPIFIRLGNRGRYPVTGNSSDDSLHAKDNARLTNTGWVLPLNREDSNHRWTEYPAAAYYPAYRYLKESAEMSNGISVQTVDQENPVMLNRSNFHEEDGRYYALKWNGEGYEPDFQKELSEAELARYGDAVGFASLPSAYNILIANVKATNVDPRYPIILAGLVDSAINNVVLEDISIQYRGGLRMRDAVQQQQLATSWNYTQSGTAPAVQTLPWLSNPFFAKNSALLPRVVWDEENSSWLDDPYNVPEMAEQYPEPSNFGILPAYGLYVRHGENIEFRNLKLSSLVEDGRHAVVLDDAANITFTGLECTTADNIEAVALVDNSCKRSTGHEYVPGCPYRKTGCRGIKGLEGLTVRAHEVSSPEPGTPPDSLYKHSTIADAKSGYSYGENRWTYGGREYSLPVTVHRPFFQPIANVTAKVGEGITFHISARNPAAETDGVRDQAKSDATLVYSASGLPDGAVFDPETHVFTWPSAVAGDYTVAFTVDDGVIPVSTEVSITIR